MAGRPPSAHGKWARSTCGRGRGTGVSGGYTPGSGQAIFTLRSPIGCSAYGTRRRLPKAPPISPPARSRQTGPLIDGDPSSCRNSWTTVGAVQTPRTCASVRSRCCASPTGRRPARRSSSSMRSFPTPTTSDYSASSTMRSDWPGSIGPSRIFSPLRRCAVARVRGSTSPPTGKRLETRPRRERPRCCSPSPGPPGRGSRLGPAPRGDGSHAGRAGRCTPLRGGLRGAGRGLPAHRRHRR